MPGRDVITVVYFQNIPRPRDERGGLKISFKNASSFPCQGVVVEKSIFSTVGEGIQGVTFLN